MAWEDERLSVDSDIYAHRLNFAGTALWTPNGSVVCNEPGIQFAPQLVADGMDGVIMAWADNRSGSFSDIYAQHLTALGVALWEADGRAFCTAGGNQTARDIASGGRSSLSPK